MAGRNPSSHTTSKHFMLKVDEPGESSAPALKIYRLFPGVFRSGVEYLFLTRFKRSSHLCIAGKQGVL